MINNQIPSTNIQIITKISMTKIHKRLAKISFGYLNLGKLEFVWNLGFGFWNLTY